MTTNNSTAIPAQAAAPAELSASQYGLPTAKELEDLVNAYFPEFSPNQPTAPVGSLPTGAAADDFLRAIPAGTAESVDGFQPTVQAGQSPTFSFLEEARGIFTALEAASHSAGSWPVETETIVPEPVTADYRQLSFAPVVLPTFAGQPDHFDVGAIRRDFPILAELVNGKPLIWLDNSATTHKPQSVIERISYFYQHENSNIHRAAHTLAARATDAYEAARDKAGSFLHASSSREIVFVRGATEAINLVAHSWGRYNLEAGDEIVVSLLEHHANIVPWQLLCAETGATLRVIPVDGSGQLLLDEFEKILNSRTKLVAVTHVSNTLGTINPVREIVQMAQRYGAKTLIDGAQAVSHLAVDVQALDCDFYVFSGHKIFAPTGIGVLYGKYDLLAAMPPYQGGGNMIADVTFEKTVYQDPPNRFEAGTGNIADAIGLGAAIDYVNAIGLSAISRYEHQLLEYGTEALRQVPGLRLIGTAKEKASVLSFVINGFTTEEIGQALSKEGIAVRAGHHCAQPILRQFGLETAVRPSLAFYNTQADIDALVSVIWELTRARKRG